MSEESDSKLKIIKENMKSVLKNNSKFYAFLFLGGSKKKLLAEGNTLKSVEKESIKQIIELVGNDMEKLKKFNIIDIKHIKKILDVINSGSPFAVRKLTDVIKKDLPLYLTA